MFTSTAETAVSVADPSDFIQAPPIAKRAPAPPAKTPRPRNEAALAEVLRHPGVWRRGTASRPKIDVEPTGNASLDARLPGAGWPRGALSEILIENDGLGECSLLLPALAALTQAGRRVVFVAPPYIPYPPALADAGIDLAHVVCIDAADAETHWTAEQCLRAGCCGAVLSWMPRTDYRQLRRLQLAAETGAAIGFVFRPLAAARETSPAALRVQVAMAQGGPRVEILKCRGRVGESSEAALLSA
ncbi:MAG: translesion DNA synthesis-associated protein ImuA [Rhodanobacteraceae bacterium]